MDRYRVLVADPPWRFDDKLPGPGRGADKHYSTLSLSQIKSFPLPRMADDSHLFLWRVAAMQREALDVMDAWGYTPKAEIVWIKKTKNGKRWFGMGRQVRMEHETCVIGVRGKGAGIRDRGIRSTFEAVAGRHSAKPEAFFDLVERLVPGPYAELFARRTRPGWTCYGNELPEAHPV